MTNDIMDKKSLLNKHIILIIIFTISITITGTHFITKELIAKNTIPIVSITEKKMLMLHLEKDNEKQLKYQKIYLKQNAAIDKIIDQIDRLNKKINKIHLY